MRVVLAGGGTGGHLYPGLAIARALVHRDPQVRPLFIGARRGIEREILPASGFDHLLLDLHPLYRARPWDNWRTVAGLAGAWRALGRTFATERPRVVVGTGGYAMGATLAWALSHRVPSAIQEQNASPGIATRLFARWAREVYLGVEEARAALAPRTRAQLIDTGNPIVPPPVPRPDRRAARTSWGLPKNGLVLLIFGGSQGARAINETVDAWITRGLPPDLHVIWGTGSAWYQRFAARESGRVRVRAYLAPIADAYAAADLALTRAGALTLAELCAWGIPAILVPLPTAAADHQTANARAMGAAGAARVIAQPELTVERLDATIRALLADRAALDVLATAATARARPQAADVVAQHVLALAARA